MKRPAALLLAAALLTLLTGCGGERDGLEPVTFVLDWTPNTNHTGVYVAAALGYYEEAGLRVSIVQPPDDGAEVLVALGRAQFGVSFQDSLAPALAGRNALPVTAVAAILQHNTSGIVSRAGEGLDRPRGLMDHRYATWDLPVEQATLRRVVEADGGDYARVVLVPSTVTDEVSALRTRAVDAVWAFYGWGGLACETAGLETDWFAFADIDPVFDYYTPVIIASDDYLRRSPVAARAFLAATTRGYEYAASHPEEAAELLMEAVPELAANRALILESQRYLSGEYIADADQWGVIDPARWDRFYVWLNDNGLVEDRLPPGAGLSTDYLP